MVLTGRASFHSGSSDCLTKAFDEICFIRGSVGGMEGGRGMRDVDLFDLLISVCFLLFAIPKPKRFRSFFVFGSFLFNKRFQSRIGFVSTLGSTQHILTLDSDQATFRIMSRPNPKSKHCGPFPKSKIKRFDLGTGRLQS